MPLGRKITKNLILTLSRLYRNENVRWRRGLSVAEVFSSWLFFLKKRLLVFFGKTFARKFFITRRRRVVFYIYIILIIHIIHIILIWCANCLIISTSIFCSFNRYAILVACNMPYLSLFRAPISWHSAGKTSRTAVRSGRRYMGIIWVVRHPEGYGSIGGGNVLGVWHNPHHMPRVSFIVWGLCHPRQRHRIYYWRCAPNIYDVK